MAACAVVAMETASGPEPCAVLAFRGSKPTGRGGHRARQPEAGGVPAAAPLDAVARAGPAAHLDRQGEAQGSGGVAGRNAGRGYHGQRMDRHQTAVSRARSAAASADWLLALIVSISGEAPADAGTNCG